MKAALLLMTVACDFLSLFKQLIIGGNVRSRLKTLHHKMLATPSIIEKSDDIITVKMDLHMNRRNWIAIVCDRIQVQFLQFD
jgi:hypothetical protein